MIVGYNLFGGEGGSIFDSRGCLNGVGEVKLENGLYDEVNLRYGTDDTFSTQKQSWRYDNVLLARFTNDLQCGSVATGLDITSIIIKKRKWGEFNWTQVCEITFDSEESIYTAYDKMVSAEETYEYAVVPMGGSVEGSYIIVDPHTVKFEGGFISDVTHNYRLFYNCEIGDIVSVRPNATFQPISGSKYPFHTYSGDLSYKTGSITALLSSTDTDDVDLVSERVLREQITAWLLNGKPKLYRYMDGTTMLINITGDVTLSPWEDITGKYTVHFEFEECGDVKDNTDLENAGMVAQL